MRHERIPMAVKLKADAACHPCETAGGYVNRLPSLERRSVNHGGHDCEVVIKHNGQVQYEIMTRKSAGWSNGEPRTDQDINEFAKFSKTSSSGEF